MPYPYNYNYNANGFYPQYSYNYPQYPQTPQPMMQNAQQTTQPQIASPSSIIWVKNQQEAAMYPIAPNNAVALWDQSAASVYLKQADASGKPSMKIYDLVERTEAPADAQNDGAAKVTAYATKEELGAVVGAIKGIDGVIASIKGDIDKMSGDLYGIAGAKKKSKKVKEIEEEDED